MSERVLIHPWQYVLVGADLCDLATLEQLLRESGLDFQRPVLILSECVLTYVDVDKTNALLGWLASKFSDAVFASYEQILPDDGFGWTRPHSRTFGAHVDRSDDGIPLPQDRQQSQGGARLSHHDVTAAAMRGGRISHMLHVGHAFLLSAVERSRAVRTSMTHCGLNADRARVNALELFDEHEEWDLKCQHYTMTVAYTGPSHPALHHHLTTTTTITTTTPTASITMATVPLPGQCRQAPSHV